MLRKLLALVSLFFLATPASAEWYEATSNNFIVYSQGSEQEARDFAAKLQRFHFVLSTVRRIPEGRASLKLRVFLLPDRNAVQRVAGGGGVVGYYVPDARGMMLVGTRRSISGLNDIRSHRDESSDIDPESVLFHEYAHHFMYQYFPATYPTWYSEGFAEFWGTTAILPRLPNERLVYSCTRESAP